MSKKNLDYLHFYNNRDYINKYGAGLVKGAQCYQYEGELTCAPIKTNYKKEVINMFKDYLINMNYGNNINIEPWGLLDCYELEIDFDFFNLKEETKTIKSFFFINFYEKDKTIIKFSQIYSIRYPEHRFGAIIGNDMMPVAHHGGE